MLKRDYINKTELILILKTPSRRLGLSTQRAAAERDFELCFRNASERKAQQTSP